MLEFALEQHDLHDGKGIAASQRNPFEGRHGPVAHPAQRQVGPESARFRIEASPHDRGLDPLGQSGERRLGLDASSDDTRASGRGERLDRTEPEHERGTALHGRRHLGCEARDRRLVDLPQEAQRQVVPVGAHPAHGATAGCGIERLDSVANRAPRPVRERYGQEHAKAHERFLSR